MCVCVCTKCTKLLVLLAWVASAEKGGALTGKGWVCESGECEGEAFLSIAQKLNCHTHPTSTTTAQACIISALTNSGKFQYPYGLYCRLNSRYRSNCTAGMYLLSQHVHICLCFGCCSPWGLAKCEFLLCSVRSNLFSLLTNALIHSSQEYSSIFQGVPLRGLVVMCIRRKQVEKTSPTVYFAFFSLYVYH